MKKNKIKIGRWLLLMLVCVFLWNVFSVRYVVINDEITLNPGGGFMNFLENLNRREQFYVKYYIYKNSVDTSRLAVGTYSFSGKYTVSDFVNTIISGPEMKFYRVKILEGWSIYDSDDYLTKQGWIEKGEYINFVKNRSEISNLLGRYDFLSEMGSLNTLEGFLYPDTYFVDINGDFVRNLIVMQLTAFERNIWSKYDLGGFWIRLARDYDRVRLTNYDLIKLASIIQKEERITANQSNIAGVFLNRLQNAMRLDADITLCYNFTVPYVQCNPSFIARNVADDNNIYNTRRKSGLTPTPISNFPATTWDAMINYNKVDYFYYLHDNSGRIHYGRTLEEHNNNRRNYLNR